MAKGYGPNEPPELFELMIPLTTQMHTSGKNPYDAVLPMSGGEAGVDDDKDIDLAP